MKKVMIYAYTYFNLGDDLFIKLLCDRYKGTQFVLYAPSKYKETFNSHKNIKYYSSDTLINRGINFISSLFKVPFLTRQLLAKQCDLSVQIGGSLFMQNGNWQKEIKHTRHLKTKSKPFYLLGANFGPFDDPRFLSEHKQIFKQYTDICFRDTHSFQLFKELRQVRKANDIVFALATEDKRREEDRITISVIKPSRKRLTNYDSIYYAKISEIIISFINRGHDVTLMSFCEYEGDQEAINAITELVPVTYHPQIDSYYYKTNLEEAIQIIASSRFIIATRFHAMILAWVYSIPVFPIIYNQKMTHVMADVNFKGPSVPLKEIHTLTPRLVYESFKSEPLDVTRQRNNAAQHFMHLDSYLKNEG